MSRTILVSNRLPVRVEASGRVTRTAGGLASALSGTEAASDGLWVGWPGLHTEAVDDVPALRASLAEAGASPVLLSEAELDGFYEGYANATLWPVLHQQLGQARFRGEAWFPVYEQVNRRFADVVLAAAQDHDTVWIHDYHLFLLPTLLRQANATLRIGFFLHTPFPSRSPSSASRLRTCVVSTCRAHGRRHCGFRFGSVCGWRSWGPRRSGTKMTGTPDLYAWWRACAPTAIWSRRPPKCGRSARRLM